MNKTFATWKKKFLKRYISKNINETAIWLHSHSIYAIPKIVVKYKKWACYSINYNVVCLKRYQIVLHIQGFKHSYKMNILSFSPPKKIVQQVFFDIFGNICKIISIDIRTIERKPHPNVRVFLSIINATVKTQYKEERSGHKILKFYKNIKNRRESWPIYLQHDNNIQRSFPKKLSLQDLKERYKWSTNEYHEKLIYYFTQNIDKQIETPRLVLMFGIPGSGKNWVLNKKRKKNHVIINVDDCLAMLPDYWRGMLELQEKDKKAHDWIQTFRGECKIIAQRLFKYAIQNRMNIVWNGTGKNINKYLNLINIAKKRGYIIELNGIWVPIELAKKRIKKRRDSYGRPVPSNIITNAVLNIPPSFKKLRQKADFARIWSNSPCISPKLIWDKQQGWFDDTPNHCKGWLTP